MIVTSDSLISSPFFETLDPKIRKYMNPDLFKQFKIEYGDLVWNDYDLCFPISDLYEGKSKKK